jgi:hypothetical protein
MSLHTDPAKPHPNIVTRDNCPVMLFAYMSNQQRCYLGIYYNRDEWIACSWNKDGSYLSKDSKTGMDLITVKDLIDTPPPEAA